MPSKVWVFPGSFDPVTRGHEDLIRRAAALCDTLYVAVLINPDKNGFLPFKKRLELLRSVCADLPNAQVESHNGLLADYVNRNDFVAVVRGLRNASDFDYELIMAQINARLFRNGVESVFLMTSPEYSFISSSAIKEIVSLNGSVDGMVPDLIREKIMEKYQK